MKKTGPYIGVTGFMMRNEVIEALAVIPKVSTYRLMVGVLMSSKTLAGQTNRWPGRYPKKEAVADIFVKDPRVLNLIHYSTDEPETLLAQLEEIVEIAGPNLDGFQLNITWPPVEHIDDFNETHPEKFLVLQIGKMAMVETWRKKKFVDRISEYMPMIDAILLDPSGGKGEFFNAEEVAEYLRAIPGSWITIGKMGIGVAGGLGPDTLPSLGLLLQEFSGLGIDAQGKLRTPQPEDALDIDAMKTYLKRAFFILDGRLT